MSQDQTLEELRIQALKSYKILDTSIEEEFDQFTRRASDICGTRISLISFVDENRQWFKSKFGLDVSETDRAISFCQYAVASKNLLVVEDAREDSRFRSNPLVLGEPHIRAYAGAPLIDESGFALGTLCVLDQNPIVFSAEALEQLTDLGKQVVLLLEKRRKLLNQKLETLFVALPQIIWSADKNGSLDACNEKWFSYSGLTLEETKGDAWLKALHPEDVQRIETNWRIALTKEEEYAQEVRYRSRHGDYRWFLVRAVPVRDATGAVEKWFGTCTDIQDQRTALEKATLADIEFRSLFDSLAFGVAQVDAKTGLVQRANQQYRSLLGYTQDELSKKTVHELTHPDDRGASQTSFDQLLSGQLAVLENEKRYLRKDGQTVWVKVTATLVSDENGRPLHITGVLQDMTAERDAIQRKIESEKRFENLSNSMAQLLWTTDASGRITYQNERWTDLAGADATAPRLVFWLDVVPVEDQREIGSTWKRSLESGNTFEIEHRIWNAKLQRFQWYLSRANAVKTASGATDYWIGTSTNIDLQVESAAAALMNKEYLSLATAAGNIGVFDWDISSDFILMNEIERQFLDLDGPIFTLAQFFERVVEDDRLNVREALQAAIVSGKPYRAEFRVRHRNGSLRQLTAQGNVVLDRAGAAARIVGVNTDVTDVRKQQNERLILDIEARSAVESSKLKTEFLANMSHEIRTPINGIIGMTHLLEETRLDAEQKKFTSVIASSSKLLLTLINDILDLSKVEAGKLELESVAFALDHLITDTFECFEPLITNKQLQFYLNAPKPAGRFFGDPSRIRQILNNLLSNALKFTSSGHITFGLSLVTGSREGFADLRFSVSDSGIGMSESVRERLFQKFHQADASTARKFGGTGLGLAICKELSELMGGAIDVKSSVGQGSEFIFTVELPYAADTLEESRAVRTGSDRKPVHQLTLEQRKQFRVLVAEDNTINQEITSRILKKAGYKVDVVANGFEAVSAVKASKFDVILMDCQMPEVDGYEATKRIRKMNFQLPIIALTANAFKADQERCEEAGMGGYVTKPIHPTLLIELLDQTVGRSVAEVAERKPAEEPVASLDCIDLSVIAQLEFLDEENEEGLVLSLIDLYQETASRLLADMRLIEATETRALSKKAHELKSCSANLGLMRVATVAQELEAALYVPSELPELLNRATFNVEQGIASLNLLKLKYRH